MIFITFSKPFQSIFKMFPKTFYGNGKKYKFEVAIDTNGSYNFAVDNEFNYTSNSFDPYYPTNIQGYSVLSVDAEVFYGELDEYTAREGENVNISTKRVSYGVKLIAENLTEGKLRINIKNNKSTPILGCFLLFDFSRANSREISPNFRPFFLHLFGWESISESI